MERSAPHGVLTLDHRPPQGPARLKGPLPEEEPLPPCRRCSPAGPGLGRAEPSPHGSRCQSRRVAPVTARTGAAIFPQRRGSRRSGRGGEDTTHAPPGPVSRDHGIRRSK